MDPALLRFHISRMIFFHQPVEGWTVEALQERLEQDFGTLSLKAMRTFLNQLEQEGLVSSVRRSKVKHYYLVRGDLAYDDAAGMDDLEQKTADVLMMLTVSLLAHMGVEQAKPVVDRLMKRVGYTYEDRRHWDEIRMATKQVMWGNLRIFGLTIKAVELIYELLIASPGACFKLALRDGRKMTFHPHGMIVRDGVPLVVGADQERACYAEVLPASVSDWGKSGQKPVSLPENEKFRIDAAHLHFGTPEPAQLEAITLRLDDEACERIGGLSLPLESELDEENKLLVIYHPITEGLLNWIAGLGRGVTVASPDYLRERMVRHLAAILEEYGDD